MQIRAVLLLITLVLVGARVIQDGEEDATCFPDNFENYRWVLAGNTWFSETFAVTSWLGVADECAKIEPGRTSIGGPRNDIESSRIEQHFRETYYYINAIQVGGKEWYWATRKQGKQMTTENVTWTKWCKGEPNRESQSCGAIWSGHYEKGWDDRWCFENYRGVCELRCDSLLGNETYVNNHR